MSTSMINRVSISNTVYNALTTFFMLYKQIHCYSYVVDCSIICHYSFNLEILKGFFSLFFLCLFHWPFFFGWPRPPRAKVCVWSKHLRWTGWWYWWWGTRDGPWGSLYQLVSWPAYTPLQLHMVDHADQEPPPWSYPSLCHSHVRGWHEYESDPRAEKAPLWREEGQSSHQREWLLTLNFWHGQFLK